MMSKQFYYFISVRLAGSVVGYFGAIFGPNSLVEQKRIRACLYANIQRQLKYDRVSIGMTQASLFRKPRVSSTHSATFMYNLEGLTLHLLSIGANENLDFNMKVQSLVFPFAASEFVL